MRKIAIIMATLCLASGCKHPSKNMPEQDIIQETYVYKYGIPLQKEDWDSRGQHGQVVTTLGNGVTVTKNYANGVLDGETTYSHPYAQSIEKTEIYSKGKLEREIWHYASGTPREEQRLLEDNGRQEICWYETGAPKSIELYNSQQMLISGEYSDMRHQVDAKVEQGNGTRIDRDAFGAIISRDQIKDGFMVLRTTYYPNSCPKEIISFKNNAIDGEYRTFHPGGEPNTVEIWSNGAKTGTTIVYQNGEKIAEITYVAGIKEGPEKRYRNGDQLMEEISWINDKKHGPMTLYVNDTPRTEWYYKDEPVTKKNFDILSRAAIDYQMNIKRGA